MTVYAVGGLSVDHLVNWREGAQFYNLGGPALYAACGMRTVDKNSQVEVLSFLPEGDNRFTSEFETRDIGYASCVRTKTIDTIWICTDRSGRVLFPAAHADGIELLEPGLGTDSQIDPISVDFGVEFTEEDVVLLSSPTEMPEAYKRAGTVLIDPHQTGVLNHGWEYLEHLVSEAQPARVILLPSRVQLRALGETSDVALRMSERLGVDVVARLDEEGMDVLSQDGRARVKDVGVPVRDTTGAGDTTAGAIAGALANGRSLLEATQLAVTVARLLLSDWGINALSADTYIQDPLETLLTIERD